jgi:hypothetical protein
MNLMLDLKGLLGRHGAIASASPPPPDYRTNLVIEYQSGNDANYSLSGDDIDVESALTGGTDFDLTQVGDAGYATKAKHNTTEGIDGIKTVLSNIGNVDTQSRHRSGVSGTLDTVITGTGFSVVTVVKPLGFNNVFSAPDPIFYTANAVFRLEGISGNVRFQVGTAGQSVAEAAWSVGAGDENWHVLICTYDNDKARVSVDGGAAAAGASSAGLLAGNLATRLLSLSNTGSGGVFYGPRLLGRIYDEVLSANAQTALLAHLQYNFPTLA